MTARGANPALAALASVASLLGLTTLVTTQTWFARMMWFVVIAAGVGALVRRFTSGSAWLVVPAQLLGVVLVATWTYAGSSTWYGLPTLATARRFGVLFAEFGVTAAASSAPMPANRGVEATERTFRTWLRLSFEERRRVFDRLGNAKNPCLDYAWEMVPRDIEQLGLVAYRAGREGSDPSHAVFPWQGLDGRPLPPGAPKTKPRLR
jgi:hypothetical protein